MHKLSKILVPIVAVLVIGTGVLSFFSYRQFQKYEKRATMMAEGLKGTGAALDAGSATSIQGKVSFSAKGSGAPEGGTLSWTEFKKDPDQNHQKFQNSVNEVVSLARKVIEQRDAEAAAIASMTLTLGLPADNMPEDALQAISSYEKRLALAQDYTKAFLNRDKQFVDSLKKNAQIVGGVNLSVLDRYPQCQEDEENGFRVSEVGYSSALGQLEAKIRDTKLRAENFQKAIASVQVILTKYSGWQFRPADLGGSRYPEALKALAADLAAVNAQLAELERAKQELARTKQLLKEREDEVAKLREEIAKKDQVIRDHEEKIRHLGGIVEEAEKEPITSIEQMDRRAHGIVLLMNAEWNFVISSLDNTQVVPGAHVIISKDGSYLASGIVKSVEDDLSLIDLKEYKGGAIPVGATVNISEMDGLGKSRSSEE